MFLARFNWLLSNLYTVVIICYSPRNSLQSNFFRDAVRVCPWNNQPILVAFSSRLASQEYKVSITTTV